MNASPLAVSVLAIAPLAAQQFVGTDAVCQPHHLDSGVLANPSATPRPLFETTVRVTGARWLRLDLAETVLAAGSSLVLRSAQDGAIQRFTADSLREYGHWSACFNGEAVSLRLVGGAGTGGNRLAVVGVERDLQRSAQSDNCGVVDPRTRSAYGAVGRLHPGGGTGFLLNEFTAVTAAHVGSPTMIHFNVPDSTAGGMIVMPPVEDQYPVRVAASGSGQSGDDWAVLCAERNSNTCRFPGEVQGALPRGPVPPNPVMYGVEAPGHGDAPGVLNRIQQTSAGILLAVGASELENTVYTVNSMSGAPLLDGSGRAIGVVVAYRCQPLPPFLVGVATRIDVPALHRAIESTLTSKTVGGYSGIGQGCPGTRGTPAMSCTCRPVVGSRFELQVGNAPPNSVGFVFYGASISSWGQIPLPLSLGQWGAPGCVLYVSLDVGAPVISDSQGRFRYSSSVPGQTALVGQSFHNQFLVLDPAANPLGMIVTGGGTVTIGG